MKTFMKNGSWFLSGVQVVLGIINLAVGNYWLALLTVACIVINYICYLSYK